MKIDRRGFLSFVAGGAAGTALSPLPWKLMDDVSIWSQNWPWVPIPKEGNFSYLETVCSLCPGGCGVTVRKVDDRAIKIEGTGSHPTNKGGVCGLGLSGLQLLHSEHRVKYPMKCVGGRGSGKWERLSWDDAISMVVDRLKSIKEDGYADKVACISNYSSGTISSLIKRFFNIYGSNKIAYDLSSGDVSKNILKNLCGVEAFIDFDLERSDFILSLGSGLATSCSSPTRMMQTVEYLREVKKANIVQVEPFLSDVGTKASQWIFVNPGSEADLAFGVAAAIIEKKLYDFDFVTSKVSNFDKWKKKFLLDYSPEFVSKVTGVGTDRIYRLAESFAKAKNPVALHSQGNVPVSSREYISAYLLNVLVGNINSSGGLWFYKNNTSFEWPLVSGDNLRNEYDTREVDIEESSKLIDYASILGMVDSQKNDSSLKALFLYGNNFCYRSSDKILLKKAFKRIPFIVNFSSFIDETTTNSDLILPNNFYLERLEDVSSMIGSGKKIINLSRPVVNKQFDTKHIGDTIIEIAHSFGENISSFFPWSNYKECLKDSMGGCWADLCKNGIWINEKVDVIDCNKFDFSNFDLLPIQIEGEINTYPLVVACCVIIMGTWIDKGLGMISGGFVPNPLHQVVEYIPSLPEIGITLGIYATGALVLTLLYKIVIGVKKEVA